MTSLLSAIGQVGVRESARLARQRIRRTAFERDAWYDTDDTCDDPAIFVVGCGRSGTTLLREMLNRHPSVACGPETTFLCDLPSVGRLSVKWSLDRAEVSRMLETSPSVVRFAETFFRRFAESEGKPRWADKTPRNVTVLPRLLWWFPNARVIHLIRDGRDVACSLRHHPRKTVRHGKVVGQSPNNPIHRCARRWLTDTSLGLAFKSHPRCCEIRYEDLVGDTEAAARRLCEFIGEEFDPAMLGESADDERRVGRLMNNPEAGGRVHGSSMGRWRRDLSPSEAGDFARVAGELLVALGYAPDHAWVDEASGA